MENPFWKLAETPYGIKAWVRAHLRQPDETLNDYLKRLDKLLQVEFECEKSFADSYCYVGVAAAREMIAELLSVIGHDDVNLDELTRAFGKL